MKPNIINEEIARFRGWTSKKVPSDEDVIKQGYDEFRHTWWYNREGKTAPVPDYSNRSTLIAKLVIDLSEEESKYYNNLVFERAIRDITTPNDFINAVHNISTQQRAEFILETYKKFRDYKENICGQEKI